MLQKSNIEKVESEFFNDPNKKFELMELSRKTKIAHTSVKNILNKLIKEKIIDKETKKKGKRNFPTYKARKNDEFKQNKRINNFKNIISSKIIPFLELKYTPRTIVLFGSYNKGEDEEDSDIDLYVETTIKEKLQLQTFEKTLKRNIQIHKNETLGKFPKELQESIINGTILYGYLELYNEKQS